MSAGHPETGISQLRLPFAETFRSFDDLAITDANRSAIEAIRRWPDWSHGSLCLIGPLRSGLGVAAKLWSMEADAQLLSASEFDVLSLKEVETLAAQNCAIDLADEVTSEDNLLTLLNLGQASDTRILFTARSSGANWTTGNADLASRLSIMPVAEIYPPDEEMVKARLLASCKGRFIKLSKSTVDFLSVRLPRSYEAIEDYVQRLDQAISDTGKSPGIQLAKTVLEEGASTRTLF